jgi:hypothetical protein
MLMANIDRMIQDAVSKMVAELKALGFDPLIDITSERIGIIIPVEQLVNKILQSVPKSVYRHVDVTIEEKTLGTKGFIVIKVKKRQ